ncbi:MAG: ATP-binding protein [Cyanobacteria bacterium P01_C01_bin.120]
MEPITWGLLAGIVFSGVVGNRADAGLVSAWSAGWRQITKRLNAPELSAINQELAIAVDRAFLWAQQSLVQECLDEFTGGTYQGGISGYTVLPGHEEADVAWLIGKAGQLKTSLKQLEKEKLQQFSETELADLEGLLQNPDRQAWLQEWLMVIVQQEQPPRSYANRAIEPEMGLLVRTAAYFELVLKTNQKVQKWFQNELLMQMNAQLQVIAATPLTLSDFEHALQQLAQQVPSVLHQINNLELALEDMGQGVAGVGALVATRTDELLTLALQNADDLATLKRLIGDLLIDRQQQGTAVTPVPPWPAQPREGPNPFIYGPAVPPDRFYGRRQAIDDIKNRIGGVEPQSINIVGLRRNGKSSMLRYVKERIHEFCTPEQKPLVVLLDLQDRRFHTPLGILEGLRRGIKKQTGAEPWAREDNNDDFELQDRLEALRDQGYRLIVLFDEFGAIGKRLEQFQDWGDDWRAKASTSLVTLVIASRRPLGEIYQTLNLTSPFDNVFSTTILGALEPEAWRQLLQQDQLSEAEISWVELIAGKLPFYSQLAAAMVWQHSNLDLAHQAFDQQAQPYFAGLWKELTTVEQQALKQTLDSSLPIPPTAVVEQLKLHGLLQSDDQLCGAGLASFVGEQP